MFSRRLVLSFASFALLALALAAVNGWVSQLAEHRVVRGRIAADLLATYLELSAEKARLRVWVLQRNLSDSPDASTGIERAARMREDVERLRDLAERAIEMDSASPANSAEHAERKRTIDLLDLSVGAMQARVEQIIEGAGEPRDAISIQSVDEVFDRYGQYDVRALLDAAILAETEALRRDRASADASLAQARLVSNLAAGLFVALALALAAYFASALRRPLRELTSGAEAFETGDLGYRIAGLGKDEFGSLATRMNQMARQLELARDRERELRQGLEAMVSERTADLQNAVADLQRSEMQRRQLLADVGHELRTPTTVIRGEAEIALRRSGQAEEVYRESLTRIALSAEQLGKQIDDLLTIALDDAGMLTLEQEMVDPDAELEKVIAQARTLAGMRQIELVPDVSTSGHAVRGDPRRIGQVLGILIDNAIRYSRPGGRVDVSSLVDEGSWRLCVRDTGIGIPAEDMDRIFERGFRTASARLHRADGSGLGLSIARALASRLGGELSLVSAPDSGTEARLAFPLADAGAAT